MVIDALVRCVVALVSKCVQSPLGSPLVQSTLVAVPALVCGVVVGASRVAVAGRGLSRSAGTVLQALLKQSAGDRHAVAAVASGQCAPCSQLGVCGRHRPRWRVVGIAGPCCECRLRVLGLE